jgi:hypothetical protein
MDGLGTVFTHPGESTAGRRPGMTLFGRNALLVGKDFLTARTLRERLARWKFRCHFAESKRAAADVLASHPVNLVLSYADLSDGSGFGLLAAIVDLPITAFLCVPLENGCLWLPAVDGGTKCLGLPSLRPAEFAKTLEEMVRGLPA